MPERIKRINELLRREIGSIIQKDLNNPHLGLITVSHVETSKDLTHGKVYISVFGSDAVKKETIKALQHTSGYIQHLISKNIIIKYTPVLQFILDDSLDYGQRIDSVIENIHKDDTAND